jgi:hypothetical protein
MTKGDIVPIKRGCRVWYSLFFIGLLPGSFSEKIAQLWAYSYPITYPIPLLFEKEIV